MMTGRPVRELQEMLQFLSFTEPALPQIIPDGKFGERTLEAVMIFQRDHGLPVTGTVDLNTWQVLREAWRKSYEQVGTPPALRVMCNGKACVHEGERIPQVPIVQAMFDALSVHLTNFAHTEIDGTYRSHTVENTKELQRISALEQTGELDRAAWAQLARLYQLYITRRAGECQARAVPGA